MNQSLKDSSQHSSESNSRRLKYKDLQECSDINTPRTENYMENDVSTPNTQVNLQIGPIA